MSVSGHDNVGGLVGNNLSSVSASSASGSVTSGGDNVGGLIGDNVGTVAASQYTGVSVSGRDNVGGYIGRNLTAIAGTVVSAVVSGANQVGGLIGANAGIGISLGDRSVVEAGCYITAGSKVTLPDGSVAKARELSGQPDMLFRRNSQSGALEAVARTGDWGGLNTAAGLHDN